jgi:hypothetical protein
MFAKKGSGPRPHYHRCILSLQRAAGPRPLPVRQMPLVHTKPSIVVSAFECPSRQQDRSRASSGADHDLTIFTTPRPVKRLEVRTSFGR